MFGDVIMKTLDLVLKRKWFEMIASGEKTEEYREIKPYWFTRIMGEQSFSLHNGDVVHLNNGFLCSNLGVLFHFIEKGDVKFKHFDKVTFYLGYSKDRPSMTFTIKEIVCDEGKEEWGALPGETYFVIKLGERL